VAGAVIGPSSLIRVPVGIEATEDLIKNFENAPGAISS
jgi:cystathionine beta-lyase/cystathionine gamma-synthase